MKVDRMQRLWPALIRGWLILWFALHAGAAADPKVIEAAKKEGQLFWWSTIAQDQSQKLIDEFMKLYPFIKANYWRSGSVGLHNKNTSGSARRPVELGCRFANDAGVHLRAQATETDRAVRIVGAPPL